MKFKWNVGKLNETPWKTVLSNRGVHSTSEEYAFLNPALRNLHSPMLMHDMERAARRIVDAIRCGEKITIYGDYDVDGITGTTTLYMALRMFNANVNFYIPHRIEEGYGLHDESVHKIHECGSTLLITVDCGITAIDPVKTANSLGMQVIISDHHEWKSVLPDAYALVHPRLGEQDGDEPMEESKYPNPDLCGSGVAFKLAWAVGMMLNDGKRVAPEHTSFFSEAIAFTALGTIADVMKLTGENRTIAYCGLLKIKTTTFPGLKGFVESAGLKEKDIDGYKVGFTLAPRLNAAGRMGHAKEAVMLLTQTDYAVALTTGAELDRLNTERQETEKSIVKEAEAYVEKILAEGVPSDVLVVLGKGWHPGVVGIVASRIMEKYHRPTLVLIQGEHHCHGSGRSVEGFNLTEAIGSCGDLVKNYGGHAMACGVRIENEKIEDFRLSVCAYAADHQTVEMKQPEIKVECEAALEEMTMPLAESLVSVGPFGPGNRRPFFVFRRILVRTPRRIGKEGQFLSFVGQQGSTAVKMVWFKPTEEALNITEGMFLDVVAEPSINEYKGAFTVQMMVRDLELSDVAKERQIFT